MEKRFAVVMVKKSAPCNMLLKSVIVDVLVCPVLNARQSQGHVAGHALLLTLEVGHSVCPAI